MKDTALNIIPALCRGSLGGSVVKNRPPSEGDAGNTGSIPEQGRSPGIGNGNPLQNSCLGNPMSRGAWQESRESQRVGATEYTCTPSLDSLIFRFLLPFILFFSYVFCGQEEANKRPSTKFSEWSTSSHKVCLHPSVPLWLISFYSPLCLLILPHQPPCCFEMYQAHSFLGLFYWLFYLPGMCFLLIYTRFTPSCLSSVCPITTSSLKQPLTILFKILSQNKWTNIKQNRNQL